MTIAPTPAVMVGQAIEHIIVEAEAYESADMMEGVGKCADYLLNADFVKADYTK